MADPNTYNVTNWLSMGFGETLNGAVNPEKPLSLQHWVDSATVVTAVYGGYSAGSAASKAKIVTKSPVKKTVTKSGVSTAKKGGTSVNGIGDSVTSNKGRVIDTKPYKNHTTVNKNQGYQGKPNSSLDILDRQGNMETRRWIGNNAKAFRDVDMTNHGNPKLHPEWPHEHFWQYGAGGKPKRR